VLALAFDPADGTLWFTSDAANELFQYSTSGVLLQSGTPSGLPGIDSDTRSFWTAGEFEAD
jgi:hypothetical protein